MRPAPCPTDQNSGISAMQHIPGLELEPCATKYIARILVTASFVRLHDRVHAWLSHLHILVDLPQILLQGVQEAERDPCFLTHERVGCAGVELDAQLKKARLHGGRASVICSPPTALQPRTPKRTWSRV